MDLDRAADVQSLREQGFEACYVGLAPEGSQTMLDNIETALAHKPLPGYEPEDAACLLLQVVTIFTNRLVLLILGNQQLPWFWGSSLLFHVAWFTK